MPRLRIVALLLLSLIATAAFAQKPSRQYKRTHQKALSQIEAGQIDAAVRDLEAFADKNPEDAETQFMLTLARAQQDDVPRAVKSLRRALELGLPGERLLAGPRELLGPLADAPALVELRQVFAHRPLQGPVVGDVTADSARFWVRTATAGEVTVLVHEAEGKEIVSQGTSKSSAKSDFTAVVQVAGLRPDTAYRYEVRIGGGGPDRAPEGQDFRAAPAAGAACKFELAFGGGAGYVPAHERMWTTIDARRPDLLLLLGDNTYSDAPKSSAMQRYCYYRRQSRPEYRKLVARTPVYAIWDDHDFGTNDCWGGPAIDEPSWKRPVWEVFRQNWVNPAYGGGPARPGCWYRFARGDVEFFMLDGRYYRTNPKDAVPSMLGPEQKAWLKQALAASRATFKVLCSPVPWEFRTKGKSRDTWNGYRDERRELFAFLADHKIEGVLLMSADRHRSDAWKIERPGSYPLYEFNSSRLTNQHVHPELPEALFSYNKKQSFGLVRFDTTLPDPTATYRIVTIDGEVVYELEVKRSEMEEGGGE